MKNNFINALEFFSGISLFCNVKLSNNELMYNYETTKEEKAKLEYKKGKDKLICIMYLIILVLFELFDFNEIQSISYFDLLYMFELIISSVFKIYKKELDLNQKVSQEIEEFINKYFIPTKRITFLEFLKYLNLTKLN